jgi:hypothetical protein
LTSALVGREWSASRPVRFTPELNKIIILIVIIIIIIISISILVRLSPLGTAATTGPFYHPHMIGDGGCGEIGGMKFGRGNQSSRRNHAPVPLC